MSARARIAALLVCWSLSFARAPELDAAPVCAVTTPIGSGNDEGFALAVQSDGKIVVAGYTMNGANAVIALVRYNADLTLDTTFGTGGIVTTPIGTGDSRGQAVAIQSDGKILVAGYAVSGLGDKDMALLRYHPNGAPDFDFDGDGMTVLGLGAADDELYDVAIQLDGKIVVAGRSYNGSDFDALVGRFTTDGQPDGTFGTGGFATFSDGLNNQTVTGVAIQPDGKIVLAGTTDQDFFVARVMPAGFLDTSFSSDGFVNERPGTIDSGKDVALQADGKIVVVGGSSSGGNGDVTVMRLHPDGSLDAGFGSGGFATTDLGSTGDQGQAVALQGDGKIVVAGTGGGAGNDIWVLRYDASGAPDPSFDADGRASIGLVGSTNARAVGIGQSGSVYVAGSTVTGALNYDFAVGRLNPDGTSPCGEVFLHPFGPGSTGSFTPQSGCSPSEKWRCVNDQASDQPIGPPDPTDHTFSYLRGSGGREMFALDDSLIPAGAIVNRIEIRAQVGKQGGGNPSYRLSYQRMMGWDMSPVDGPLSTAGQSCCFDTVSWIVSGISWTEAQLDSLEIGVFHTGGTNLDISQLFVKVNFVLAPPTVTYRSIGTAPDYFTGTVTVMSGSLVVTGAGTAWRSAKRGRGDRIGIDGIDYTILEVDSESQLTLTTPFQGIQGSGKPYTISRQHPSPSAWADCINGNPCDFFPVALPNLVAENRREVGIIYDDGASYGGTVFIFGTVTDATHDIVLTVNPVDRHFGRADVGAAIDGGPGAGISIQDDHVTVEWLEIRNATGPGIDVSPSGPMSRVVLRNNLVHNVGASGIQNASTVDLEVYNNVVYNVNTHGIDVGPASGSQLYNNTVFSGPGSGMTGTGAGAIVRNNLVHSFAGADFAFGSVDPSSSNNLSEDATAGFVSPGGGERTNVLLDDVDFVSTAMLAEDLHIRTTSAAKDAGAGLSLFDRDIDDAVRGPIWDIGADEFGAPVVAQANYHSIGTYAGVLISGMASVGLGSTAVNFSVNVPSNVGIGDKLVLDPGGPNEEIFYVLSIDTATQLTVQSPAVMTHTGQFAEIRRAFNTLQIWETARQGDLVLENRREIGVVYDDGPFFDGVIINDSNTDAAHFMTLTVAPGERHQGRAGTGARVDGGNGQIWVVDDFSVVEWLEVTGVGGAGNAGVGVMAQNVILAQLLLHGNTTGALLTGAAGYGFTIRNSILYRNVEEGIRGNTNLDAITVQNCTIYGNGQQGIEAISTPFTITNTISMANPGGDFVVGAGSFSNNMSSDASAPGTGSFINMIPINEFVSIALGLEDLHLKPGAVAIDDATNLNGIFQNDIDDQTRQAPWDMGADELGGGMTGPAPTLSSFASQTFVVGGPISPVPTLTITDHAVTPTITAAADLRIRIPAGFPMRFDLQPNVTVTGPASLRVASQVKAYEDQDRTVVLDVLSDFVAGDQVSIDNLEFWSFTAPAGPANLELEVGNDGLVSALDDKTITINPDGVANLSSDDDQVFTTFQSPTPALPFTVSEGNAASINPTNDIRIRIPGTFNMTWDTGVGIVSLSGPAAGKVATAVTYDDNRTLVLHVATGFSPGDYVRVSGPRFLGFSGPSAPSNLQLDVGSSTDTDDKTIAINVASDVQVFTATAKNQLVKLEWLAPAVGLCDSVLILRRNDGFPPSGPLDSMAFTVATPDCTLGARGSVVDDTPPLANGTRYDYAIFVEYGGGNYTSGKYVKARPMDTTLTDVRWAYSTGATSMVAPGLRFKPGASYVYAVSNDRILHSMNGGDLGGDWPTDWKPFKLGGPAQARPPVVSFAVGSAIDGAAFLGSQDGSVYAVDAKYGTEVWRTPIASMVQAAPAAHFAPPAGPLHFLFVGTRDDGAPNSLKALDVNTGAVLWSFTNASGPQNGDGKEIGIILGSASVDYQAKEVFFASNVGTGANGSTHTLWCVNFSSGAPQLSWSLPLGDIDGSPVLSGTSVYVGTRMGVVYAIDRTVSPATIQWSHSTGDGLVKSFIFPQRGTNRILLATVDKIWSFEDMGGSYFISWSTNPVDVPGPSTPIFVPGTGKILVGSTDGHLYQLDAFNPNTRERVQLGDGTSTVGVPSVDILKSMIYVGTEEGVIYGVRFPLTP